MRSFRIFFSTSSSLNIKVAFFSDSIVLTTEELDNLEMLFLAIWMAESYLNSKTGLLFRGGITEGLFYHEETIAFGPAIINSYRLENQANYSRVVIQDELIEKLSEKPFVVFKDTDGKYCFNPSVVGLLRNISDSTKVTMEQIEKGFKEEREFVLSVIKNNLHTSVSDKYLWRIRPFNLMCEQLTLILNEYKVKFKDVEIQKLKANKILLENFFI